MNNSVWNPELEDQLLDYLPAHKAKEITAKEIAKILGVERHTIVEKIRKMSAASKEKREALKVLYLKRFDENNKIQNSGTNIIIIQGIKLAKRICVICARPFSIEAHNPKQTDCYYCNDIWRKAEGKKLELGWKSDIGRTFYSRKIPSQKLKETGVNFHEAI